MRHRTLFRAGCGWLGAIAISFAPACSSSSSDNGNPGGGGTPPGTVLHQQSFDLPNGSSWPMPWTAPIEGSSPILDVDIQDSRARLRGATTQVTRMILPAPAVQDFDAVFRVRFENIDAQGIGFYGRQNGGRLQATSPHGQGYAVFLEGSGQQALGLWHETDGVEMLDAQAGDGLGVGGIANGTDYVIRFEVEQVTPNQTEVRARVWALNATEPNTWHVTFTSTVTELQNLSGGFAVDVYNYSGTSAIYVDELTITSL